MSAYTGKIRVDKDTHSIYEELVSRSGEKADLYPFRTMKDLFVTAACLGFQKGKQRALSTSQDIFSGDIFDDSTDWLTLSVIAYSSSQNLEVLSRPDEIVQIAEAYANEGIKMIKEELLDAPGRPLENFMALIDPM